MRRAITSEDDLEGHKRGNEGLKDTALTWCGVVFLAVATLVLSALLIAVGVFIIFSGIEYYNYLLQNKEKLFDLLQWLATHSVGVVFGATPFFLLWKQKR